MYLTASNQTRLCSLSRPSSLGLDQRAIAIDVVDMDEAGTDDIVLTSPSIAINLRGEVGN